MDTFTQEPAASGAGPTAATASFGPLALAGMASLGAGAIHAAAIGAHAEHRPAVITFTLLATAQLVWGAVALAGRRRAIAIIGVALGFGAVAGWLVAKTVGLSFVAGLDDAEPAQLADSLAAGLALLAGLGSARVALQREAAPRAVPTWVLSGLGIGILALTVSGMFGASTHAHAEGDDHGHDETAATDHGHAGGTTDHADAPAAAPDRTYDPTKPLDLSGVQGVTKAQEAKAERLVAVTLDRLPQFADSKVAESKDFHSIGDGVTGAEHFINWSYIDDEHVLNPDYPEALVYEPQPDGSRKLVSAMFMLKQGQTLDDVPEVGGNLMQWHIHDDLCFLDDPVAPRIAGITSVGGSCRAGLEKFTPVPMIHVWITRHPCGPFAALEGIGAGQIKEGEERLCDHVHGSGS